MKARLGAILCLLLGAILIQNGLSAGTAGAGAAPNPCFTVGVSAICPNGSIVVTEKTDKNGNPAVHAPSSWSLELTSNCYVAPANQAKTVPDNGSVTFSQLYVYTSAQATQQCSYTLKQTPVAPFTTTFDPPSPYTFLDGVPVPTAFKTNTTGLVQDVTITNKAPAAPKPSSSSASATKTATPSVTSQQPTPSSSSSPILATTGPHTPVRGSLIAGIALCVLGGALLFAGRRRPRTARHT